MSRRVLFMLMAPLLIWHAGPSDAREMCRFECAGRTRVRGAQGVLAKRIVRGRVPSKGHIHVLVVFARFRDEAPSERWAPAYAEDLFDPNLRGSFSHFYREMSCGQLSVSGTCLKKRYASLHNARYYFGLGDEMEDRVGRFTEEILVQVDRDVDLGQYDNDGPDGIPNSGDDDGYVDFLVLNLLSIPQGFIEATATGIACIGLAEDYATADPARRGGVIMISGVLGSVQRTRDFSHAVGSMAHEFGHALGLPDLYDTSFLIDPDQPPEEDSAGIGSWGLMGRGATGWNGGDGPNPLCAWSREQLGWIGEDNSDLVDVREDMKDVVIRPAWDGGTVYRIPLAWDSRTGSMGEYFLIEHRDPSVGYYDRHMPGSGLLIWHVTELPKDGEYTYEKPDNRDERYKGVDLECADGLFEENGMPAPVFGRDDLDFWAHDEAYREAHEGNLGDATDPFDGVRYTEFSLDSNPASDDNELIHRCASTGFSVRNIRRRGEDMVADLSVPKWYGEITGDIAWGGTVQVIGDLTVTEGATLFLQPGTRVWIATSDVTAGGVSPDRCEIEVYGTVISRGTPALPVVFSSAGLASGDTGWHGICLHPEAGIAADLFLGGMVIRHARHGIFWYGHEDKSGIILSDPLVVDRTLGNGDGRANPGETFEVELSLTNWTFVTFSSLRLRVTSRDEFVWNFERTHDSFFGPISPGETTHSRRITVTVASDCPPGREIGFNAEIIAWDVQVTGEDEVAYRRNLTWRQRFTVQVTGEDESVPEVRNCSVSPTHVWVGGTVTISAEIEEPGPLGSVMARIVRMPDSVQVARVPLQEDGRGRGVYTALWAPMTGSDFLVYVEATDTQGNMGISPRPAKLFSRMLDKTADVLLYTEKGMRSLCERALRGCGIPYDVWDYGERGLLEEEMLGRYAEGMIVWTSFRGVRGRGCMESIREYLGQGGNLLLLTGDLESLRLLSPEEIARFYEDVLQVEDVGISRVAGRLTGGVGDPITGGFSAQVSRYGWMSVWGSAKPILLDDSGRAAAIRVDGRSYRVVYLAFDLSLLGSASDREHLVGGATEWLLSEQTPRERDVALERVLSPERYVNHRAVIPSVQIINLGMRGEQGILARCVIERDGGKVYADRQTVWHLRSGEVRRFSFRPWIPGVGTYELTFYLDLPEDEDKTNNLLRVATDVGAFLDVSSSVRTEWRSRSCGIAAGDYDGDGDLDVFVACFGGTDRLYRNEGEYRFTEVSFQPDGPLPGTSRGGAWGDYDNDGDLDLYVASQRSANVLYRNEGDGTFTDATRYAGVGDSGEGRAALWGDYDNDGWLDLYVANGDGRGVLYHNGGDGQFVRVRDVAVGSIGEARGAAWWDYEDDGDLDLYVVAYGGGSVLYRNNGNGTFSDQTVSSGLEDRGRCNGLAAGDYDNDGDLDLYVSVHGGANRLYRNNGDGTFTDVAAIAGVGDRSPSTGVSWGDYDNDGWLDLYVVNWSGKPNRLYRNERDGTFQEVGGPCGVADEGYGCGVAFADYNNDGNLDLYVANHESDGLYRNRGNGHHYLRVRTVGAVSNRDGIGCRVKVVAGELRMIREISGGGGYCSQDGLWAQFGLGERSRVDTLMVRWPSGALSVLTSLPVDREIVVREPPSWKGVSEPAHADTRGCTQMAVYPNPFNSETTIRYSLSERGMVHLVIHNLTGQCVRVLLDEERSSGSHSVVWDGTDDEGRGVASGVYLSRMGAKGSLVVRKLLLVR